jgi:hypothetical protein
MSGMAVQHARERSQASATSALTLGLFFAFPLDGQKQVRYPVERN